MAWKIAKAGVERETFTGKKIVSLMGYGFNFWRGGKNHNPGRTLDSIEEI